MIQYAPNSRVLAPFPNYKGAAYFLAVCTIVGALAYLLIADWISSNLTLNMGLIALSFALMAYCGRTTWTLYRASELMDTLDGTVELGRPSRAELLQLGSDAQKVRAILDVKVMRAIIHSIQAQGDFDLSSETVMQLRSRAEKASVSAERGTDAGMLIVPLLAMAMGAWSFISGGGAGKELNASIMSPLMVGFLSASLLVLLNKQSQHARALFSNHFQQWLTLRSAQSNKQNDEIMKLRTSLAQLEKKVSQNKGLTQELSKAISALTQQDGELRDTEIANPVPIQNQKIIQQATDTRRVMQATRKEDREVGQSSLFQSASNDEHNGVQADQGSNSGQDRSAAA